VVVTFRQVDPLYTLDLGDPTRPTVIGELKIPGFSAYLHPIGGDLILGVGQDATSGSQVSSFDLGDLAAPDRLDILRLGLASTSAVESDSRAFTYLPEQRLALVPTTSWRRGSSLHAVGVDDGGGLSTATTIMLPGRADKSRVLPLDDGRVAIVSAGDVIKLADPGAW
jgi:uncharacterized secreted protein with C-terminal beta-propeller domain